MFRRKEGRCIAAPSRSALPRSVRHLTLAAHNEALAIMLSTRLAAALQRRDIHYGWVVVAVTFLAMLVTAGAMGAGGVLIVPLQKEFGWDTAEISSAIALRILLYGLLGPFAAAFLNRFGLRPV